MVEWRRKGSGSRYEYPSPPELCRNENFACESACETHRGGAPVALRSCADGCTHTHSVKTHSEARDSCYCTACISTAHLEAALRWPRGGEGRTCDGTNSSVRFSMLDRGSREGVRGRVCNRTGGDIGRTRVQPVGAKRGGSGSASDGRHKRTRGTQEGNAGGLETTRRRRQRD